MQAMRLDTLTMRHPNSSTERANSSTEQEILDRSKIRWRESIGEEERHHESEGVFRGPDALRKFLNPENIRDTPLVELPADLNPFLDRGISICAKLMSALPLMNVKSIPAYSMLEEACERSLPKTLVESSSLNTVGSLGIIGRIFGVDDTVAIVDETASPGLISSLQLYGIRVIKHPTVEDPSKSDQPSRVMLAKRLSEKLGWTNVDQYSNPTNPQSHCQHTAPQIWRQTNGRLTAFVTGLGTAGTMCGVSNFLKGKRKSIQTVGVVRAAGTYVPGPRTLALLDEVNFPWKDGVDALQDVTPHEAYSTSLKLIRRGIIAGPSSGLNLAGAIKYLEVLESKNQLQKVRDADGKALVVFLCCDTPFPHLESYFKVLPEEYFPAIEHSSNYHDA